MKNIRIGFAVCGSFCTFSKVIPELERLCTEGFDVTPIMSPTAYSTDTRFGRAEEFTDRIKKATGKEIITTIAAAEPIGPKKLFDILIIAPCTGNTLGKLAAGIADTSVTLAAKSHLRNGRPLLIGVSTNDALGSSYRSTATLKNQKNFYFIPMKQDDCETKPNSLVADFGRLEDAMYAALDGRQLQPFFAV